MNPQITDLSKELQHRYHKAIPSRYYDDEIIEAEITWNFSEMLSRLLSYAEVGGILHLTDLSEFHHRYEAEHSISIDLEGLITRQWIRLVCGRVYVATRINSAIFY